MPNTGYFTGSGATGVAVEDAVGIMPKLSGLWARVTDNLVTFENPGKSDNYHYMKNLISDPATRLAQADTLLSHRIARTSTLQTMLERLEPTVFQNNSIRAEIINAPTQTRGQYITTVAARYNLEPEMIAAIILTEQRDQSEAEDIADFGSAIYMGRDASSLGLGQVTGTTARLHNLLSDIFTPTMFSPSRFGPGITVSLLADEAVNINAAAKYIRLVANAGAQVQTSKRNDLHMRDPRCDGKPSDGEYVNQVLHDLSVLQHHSSQWTAVADPSLPATLPDVITLHSDASEPFFISPVEWDLHYRGQYYVRLVGTEYTSCPFDLAMLLYGITDIENVETESNPAWIYLDDAFTTISLSGKKENFSPSQWVGGRWGWFVSDAFNDCKRSTRI